MATPQALLSSFFAAYCHELPNQALGEEPWQKLELVLCVLQVCRSLSRQSLGHIWSRVCSVTCLNIDNLCDILCCIFEVNAYNVKCYNLPAPYNQCFKTECDPATMAWYIHPAN